MKEIRNNIIDMAITIMKDKLHERESIIEMFAAKEKNYTVLQQQNKEIESAIKIMSDFSGCW